jgi:hypothetical protein
MNISQLKTNKMIGYGLFSSFRKDKKEPEKSYLELDQLGGKLTFIVDNSVLINHINSALSSKTLLGQETILSYSAKVTVQSEAKHIVSKSGNEFNFVGNRLSIPVLESLEIVKEK